MPTERELEVLRAALDQQRHSVDEPFYFATLAVHMRGERDDPDNDLEGELVEVLASLQRQGYVERVGETHDLARFPLYKVTAKGVRVVES